MHVAYGFVEQGIAGGENHHRDMFVDKGDRAMLKFTRCISLCVDIADFFEFQSAFESERIHQATAEEKDIAGLGQLAGRLGNFGFDL